MQPVSLILLLFFLTTALSLVAVRVKIPYPTAMVIAGLLIGLVDYLIPGAERLSVPLNPDVLFTLILPPLLYAAAWTTPWGEFRKNLRSIFLLAVGCVFFTTAGVAVLVMAFMPGVTWPVAFALGAIVSPPDAVAATAVTQRLRIPRRIVTILDGESLMNDASALVALRFAVAAIGGASFGFGHILGQFPLVAGGGVAVGLVLAWGFHQIHARLEQPLIETAITVLTPYACYIVAERLHGSGVLAVVTCGLVLSRHAPHLFSARTRLNAIAFWDFFTFMLNGLVFILIGLQLPAILHGLEVPLSEAMLYAVMLCVAVVGLRFLWVYPVAYLSRLVPWVRRHEPPFTQKSIFLVAWIGMRGVVSLAAALALPEMPRRDLVLFLTFSVILVTLVAQSLTLPAIIKLMKIEIEEADRCEESDARRRALGAALAALKDQPATHAAESLRQLYTHRLDHLAKCDEAPDTPDTEQMLLRQSLRAQRDTLVKMRDKGEIPDELHRKLEHELDLEESRLPE